MERQCPSTPGSQVTNVTRLQRRIRIARKGYDCLNCRDGIKAGQRYVKTTTKVAGKLTIWKWHADVEQDCGEPKRGKGC